MTTVTSFSRQNDAGLRALNVFLRENLVLVVVLVLESEGPYYVLDIPPAVHQATSPVANAIAARDQEPAWPR